VAHYTFALIEAMIKQRVFFLKIISLIWVVYWTFNEYGKRCITQKEGTRWGASKA
jgi:hypothetical protein